MREIITCPLTHIKIDEDCPIHSCMWWTASEKYSLRCAGELISKNISDIELCEIKEVKFSDLEDIKKVDKEGITRVIILKRYLNFVEDSKYRRIKLNKESKKEVTKFLYRFPFYKTPECKWTVSKLLAMLEKVNYEEFKKLTKINKSLIDILGLDKKDYNKLLKIKRTAYESK